MPNYLADHLNEPLIDENDPAIQEAVDRARKHIDYFLNNDGPDPHGPDYYHTKLGKLLYYACGVAREDHTTRDGIAKIRELRADFMKNVRVPGRGDEMNQVLERTLRLYDYFTLAELMCVDALDRDESCGAHYRLDHLSDEGEAERDDEHWCFVSAWEDNGEGKFIRHAEPLHFESIPLQTRNYK